VLYYIFTVDGDWKEYFDVDLLEKERLPDRDHMIKMIEEEMKVAERFLEGRFVHFIHTSPRVRTFFLEKSFIELWKQIVNRGGDIGIHCHEGKLDKAYYFHDIPRMRKIITQQTKVLRENSLEVKAYRGGYLAFNADLIKVLEENGISFDLSCEPGRHLILNDQLVSDWRGAPQSIYRMSYGDHRKVGSSNVLEIPIGMSKGQYLYFEKSEPKKLKQVASDLKSISEKESRDVIVSVLTHSYEYEDPESIKQVEEKIAILKQYGNFINLKKVSELI
jgi:hypothetical protein